MDECKFPYPGKRFDGLSSSLPDQGVAHYDRDLGDIEQHLFLELRSKFIRTMREWPICPLHGAVKLSRFTLRAKLRKFTEIELFFGCYPLREGDDRCDLDQYALGPCKTVEDFFATPP